MNAMHKKIRTTDHWNASDVAKWILACCPAAMLTAMVLYPAEVLPWLAKLLEVLK